MSNENTNQDTAASTGSNKPVKQKWSLKKKVTVALGVVVAVIAGLVLVANAATREPVKVSNQLVSYIQAKNATAAYDLLSRDAKDVTDVQDFSATVNQIGPILTGKPNMQSKEVSAQTGRASTAKVVYEISGSDSLVYVLTVNLVKEDDLWKVQNFESVKKSNSASDSISASLNINKEVQSKCMTEVSDDTFCKFVGVFANVAEYTVVMNTVSGGQTSVANISFDSNGDGSMVMEQDGTTIANIVYYSGATYVQNPESLGWIKYDSTNTDAPSIPDIRSELVKSDFKNDNGKKDQYFNKGRETINGVECIKYQVVDADKPNDQGFMWFDSDTYLLRQLSNKDSSSEFTMTFSYGKVTIAKPSPVEDASL